MWPALHYHHSTMEGQNQTLKNAQKKDIPSCTKYSFSWCVFEIVHFIFKISYNQKLLRQPLTKKQYYISKIKGGFGDKQKLLVLVRVYISINLTTFNLFSQTAIDICFFSSFLLFFLWKVKRLSHACTNVIVFMHLLDWSTHKENASVKDAVS